MPKKAQTLSFWQYLSLLTLMGFSSRYAMDNFLPSLPAIQESLHTTASAAQMTIVIFGTALSASCPFYGPISDTYGRRRTVLLALSLLALGALICGHAPTMAWLFAGRIVQGLGAGASITSLRAMMRDTFSGNKLAKLSSYLGAVLSATPPIAPIIGGYIQVHGGWRMNFTSSAIFFVLVFLAFFFSLPETAPLQQKQSKACNSAVCLALRNYKTLLSNGCFMRYASISAMGLTLMLCYLTMSPFLFQKVIGLNPVQYGWLAAISGSGMVLGNVLNGNYVERFGVKRLLRYGALISLSSALALLATGLLGHVTFLAIMLPIGLMFIGMGFVFGNSFSLAVADLGYMAGTASALFATVQGGIATTFGALAALLHEHNQIPMALLLILATSIMLVLTSPIRLTFKKAS